MQLELRRTAESNKQVLLQAYSNGAGYGEHAILTLLEKLDVRVFNPYVADRARRSEATFRLVNSIVTKSFDNVLVEKSK